MLDGKGVFLKSRQRKDFVAYTRVFRRRVSGEIDIPEGSTVQEYLHKQKPNYLLIFNARWSRRGEDGLYHPEETELENVAIPTATTCLLHGYKSDGIPRGHYHGRRIGKQEHPIWLKIENMGGNVSGSAILPPEIKSKDPAKRLQTISRAVYDDNFFVLGDPENENLLRLFQEESHWVGTDLEGSMPYCIIINRDYIVGCGDLDCDDSS